MVWFKRSQVLLVVTVCIGMLAFLAGCGSVLQEQKKESSSTSNPSTQTPPPQVGKKTDKSTGRYYDFEDVQIPNELTQDAKNSKVFQSPNLIAGVLSFDGYVDVKSLVNFFKDAMARDNWQSRAYFILPPKTVLLFEKKNKRSIIFIEEGTFNTKTEVWMIPTSDGQ
ncbi:MAG TPA: hypothetical protein VK564_02470 [Thermodesulfobacteriota bacterium]|nr:hypothetical protein [Thermodesulfobacteriota bacterium]